MASPGDSRHAIDLSCDLGEVDPKIEDAIWPLITSANVACGAHAGDESTMRHAAERAKQYGVRLGAHPSYPDRENFGRRSMKLPPDDLRRSLADQIRALIEIAGTLTHVKPHGALYNDAHHDEDLARTVAAAVRDADPRLALVSSADSALYRAADEARLLRIAEAFADRRYRKDGSLLPRSHDNALLLSFDEAASQALSLAHNGTVVTDDGTQIRVKFDTICIHGDMPGAPARLRRIREVLSSAGFA